jgi:hypothetical protein
MNRDPTTTFQKREQYEHHYQNQSNPYTDVYS